jgi:hypothetical protein
MRNHRITDADASTLVTGRAPVGRPELEVLATSLSEFRAASFESAPQPSAALAARLSLGNATEISTSQGSAFDAETIETTLSPSRDSRARKGLVRTVFSWIAGLGLALKIALGTVVAAAAVTGAGAAGVLPFGTQDAFDEVVSVVVPADTDDGTDDGVDDGTDDGADDGTDAEGSGDGDAGDHYDPADGNFGSWVSDKAHNKPDDGKNFGELVSGEAHNKPHPGATDESQVEEGDDDESGDDEVNQGVGPQSDHGPAVKKGAH